MDFKVKNGEQIRLTRAVVATDTVIEPGDLVELSSGVIIKATDSATAVAYCPNGSADGETVCDVSVGNDFTLVGTADANFAVTDKGAEVDLVVSTGVQLIDLGESSTDVFKVAIGEDAGTVDATTNVEVRINKPLF
jgi:hypothetical protein